MYAKVGKMEYLKKINWGHVLLMCIGNIFIGMGIAVFKFSGLGNDPFSGMVMALSECVGIVYARFLLIVNLVLFLIQFLFGKKFIGIGTLVNATLLGYIATFFYETFQNLAGTPTNMVVRLAIMAVGVVVVSFGLSMYQKADVGVAPYDSLSLIMHDRWEKLSYFWCRISNDGICAVICYFSGGIVGIGTFVCALGLGPVIQFFDVHFTDKLLKKMDS